MAAALARFDDGRGRELLSVGAVLLLTAFRLLYPQRRTGGKGEGRFERISWDEAFTRIARMMKDDRDKNFEAENKDGVTVNRWLSTGFLAASASSNETGYLTHKVVRSLGILGFDNQARV